MSIINVKFDVYFKRELGTLFKSNEVDLDGLEANVNLDLDLVESMKVNYLINGNKLTDDIAIKDIEKRLILIPFKSEVRVADTKIKFEIQANMKNGDVKVSQTYVYDVEMGIGEGTQVGTGGSGDGHTHNNLSTLHKITEAKIKAWDAKSDFSGSYNDLTNKPTIPTVDVTKSYVDGEVSKKADRAHSHSEYATPSYVQEKIAEASLSGGDVDLSAYATKAELNTKADKSHTHNELHSHSNKTVLDGITSSKVNEWNNKSTFNGDYNSLTNKPVIPSTEGLATESYVQAKIADAQLGGGTITTNIEPLDDDIPRIFFSEGTLPTTKDSKTMKIEYFSKTKTFSGYVDIKCQGTSSMSYPKKNFTIKIYRDHNKKEKLKQNFRDWGEQNKFCLKANYIDISHARNVVSAKLWGDCVESRNNFDTLPNELKTSPNYGAIDGFFVKVYSNGEYQGRYTMNIPKDGWMANMDSSLDTHCILCGENYESSCFRKAATINGSDWSDELHDSVPSAILDSWNNAINHVMNSDDKTFKANLGKYFDIESLIDYYCFQYAICGLDSMGKNQLYLTYDGIKWFASSYDMDSTWGLYWNGSSFVSSTYRMQEDYESMADGRQGNLLYMRLEQCFVEEIKERYAQLRNGALSIANIVNRFENFMICSSELIEEDCSIFTGIPSKTTNNLQQIRKYAVERLAYVDECIDNLKTPVLCTSLSLNASTLTFTDATPQNLTATVEPLNTTETISWQSTPAGVVTIVNGLVTPLKNGTCVIAVNCGSQTATCEVVVDGLGGEVAPEVPEGYIRTRFLYDLPVTVHSASQTTNTCGFELRGSKAFDLGPVDNEYTDRVYSDNPAIASVSDKDKKTYDDRCVGGCTDNLATWLLLKLRKTDLTAANTEGLAEYLIQTPTYLNIKVKDNVQAYPLSEVVDSFESKDVEWSQTGNPCAKFEIPLPDEIFQKISAAGSGVFVSSIGQAKNSNVKYAKYCCFDFYTWNGQGHLGLSIDRRLIGDSFEGFKEYIVNNNVRLCYLE